MSVKQDETMLTVEEVATLLSIPVDTVNQKARAGEIPAYKYYREWRFNKSEIKTWLESKKN